MKKAFKAGIILVTLSGLLSACKGGVTGEKMDSTMVNKQARDSTSALNSKAGTMSHDSNTVNKDSVKNDTVKH